MSFGPWGILSKSESPGSPDSADNFEFSAERLSENTKSIKITLFAEFADGRFPYLCSVTAKNFQ